MKYKIIHVLFSALLLVGLTFSGDASAAELTKIKVGMLKPNLVSVIHWIAMKTGSYEKNGLEVEEHPFPSGQSVAGVEELLRGNLYFYIGAGSEVARANSRSIELGKKPPLAVIEGATAGVTSIVIRKDLEGKTMDELKNMNLRIGISSPSSIHLALFRASLGEIGLTTDDLKWQLLRTKGGDMTPALLAGSLDGFMHSEPTTTLALTHNVGFVFMNGRRGDMGETAKIIPMTFISTNRAYAEANPDVVKKFLSALYDANKAYESMPKAEMVEIMSEWAKQKVEILNYAYDRLDPRAVMDRKAAEAWWKYIGSLLKKRGSVIEKVTFDDIFDLSYQNR